MSRELHACLHAAEFPAQALLRLRADLKARPVAVLDGPAHDQYVCARNRLAAQRGAVHGLSRMEAEGIAGVQLLMRSHDIEQAARAVLLEAAAQFSPRMEEVSAANACSFVLDVAGCELLFGPTDQMAARIRESMAAAGFRVSVAISANFHVARIKAASGRGIAIVPAGEEGASLAKLPLSALALEENPREIFAVWGIRTLGELAALPEVELVARLGAAAGEWRALARGVARHTFQPIEAAFTLRELYEFDSPVEQMDRPAVYRRAHDRLPCGTRCQPCIVFGLAHSGDEAGRRCNTSTANPSRAANGGSQVSAQAAASGPECASAAGCGAGAHIDG